MDLIEAGIIRIKTVSIIFIRCNLTCVYLDLPLSDRRVVVDEFLPSQIPCLGSSLGINANYRCYEGTCKEGPRSMVRYTSTWQALRELKRRSELWRRDSFCALFLLPFTCTLFRSMDFDV